MFLADSESRCFSNKKAVEKTFGFKIGQQAAKRCWWILYITFTEKNRNSLNQTTNSNTFKCILEIHKLHKTF